jgi:hypothetical protein
VLLAASAATGAAVALSGMVGFVGLIVPHAARRVLGPDHRLLLPASTLFGAAFLVIADALARVAFVPLGTEPPVGALTAFLGGPLFLWLLRAAPIAPGRVRLPHVLTVPRAIALVGALCLAVPRASCPCLRDGAKELLETGPESPARADPLERPWRGGRSIWVWVWREGGRLTGCPLSDAIHSLDLLLAPSGASQRSLLLASRSGWFLVNASACAPIWKPRAAE